jgi:hypothetical protein
MDIKSKLASAAFGALMMASATTAFAAAAPTSPAILAPGDTVAVPDFLDGVVLVAAKTEDFGAGPGPTGTLTEFVASNSFASPFGLHDLAFAFSLSMSAGDVAKISLPGYAAFGTAVKSCNASACIEGTGDPPDLATRSANGDVVSFLFNTPLTGKSAGFVIYTNATSFADPPVASIFDSSGDVSFASVFLPAGVPEPATWAMMLLGFGAAGAMLRRRPSVVAKRAS